MNPQQPNDLRDRIAAVGSDITERKVTEQTLVRLKALLSGIERILHEALTCQTEEELGEVCLGVAEEITESRFGFIGEIEGQHLEEVAISNPGWDACAELDPHGYRKPPGKFELHGIYGRVLLDGKSFFTNDPTHHPDRVGVPVGHPPLESSLGVPLIHEDCTIGMIGLANRPGGYTRSEQDCVETPAPVIVEAFMRKRAEQALRESEERFHRLFEDDLTGNFLCTPGGQILLCNAAFAEIFGFSSPDEAIGTSILDLYVDLGERAPMLQALKQQAKLWRHEAWLKRRDGDLIYVVENIVGHFDERGELFEMQGYIFDDTERKKAEEELRDERARLSSVLENMPVGIWILDSTGRATAKDKAADRIWAGDAPLSSGPEEYVDYAAWDVETGKRRGTDDYPLTRTLRTGLPITPVELRIRRFNGTEGFIMMSTAPLRGPGRVTERRGGNQRRHHRT